MMPDSIVHNESQKGTTDLQVAAATAVAVALAREQILPQVAAAAVTTALLFQSPVLIKPAPAPGALLSPWQLIMRSNQLAKKSRGSLR